MQQTLTRSVRLIGVCIFIGQVTGLHGQDRHWLTLVEDAAFIDRDGLTFGDPGRLLASPRGGFVLYDRGDGAFREFSSTGDLLWESGTRGNGPGEFVRPLDYEFDASGNLMVVDDVNVRLTVLGPDGTLVDTHRLPLARQILPNGFAPDGWAVMPTFAREDTLWSVRGGASRRFERNPPSIDYREPIVGEAWAANLKSGGAVVIYRWSGTIVWLDPDGAVRNVTQGVEPIPFPEPVQVSAEIRGVLRISGSKVDPAAIEHTQTQPAPHGDRIYVLCFGATEHRRKIVDTYAISNGEYLGSYLLPHAVRSIAVLEDGRLATMETEFFPTVRLWRIE